MAYIQPQLQIFQEFRQLPQNVVANLNAFIVGPHYKLFRYSEASEKQFTHLGDYVAGTYDYPGQPFGSVVDTDYVKLFLEDVLARYATVTDADLASLSVTGDGNNQVTAEKGTQDLIFAAGNSFAPSTVFGSRGVRVGDTVKYTTTAAETGMTRVVGFLADTVAAGYAATEADEAVNAAGQAATDLVAGVSVVAGSGNLRAFDGVGSGVYALDDTISTFPGAYAAGLLSDTLELEITTAGVAGVARGTVRSVTGTYVRTGVAIEAGNVAGTVIAYLGRNLVMRLVQGDTDADAVLQLGDVYRMGDAVDAPFAKIDAVADITVSGTYTGARDTVYALHVVRGGVFERTYHVIDGLNSAAADGAVLAAAVDFATGWVAGDVDDEYVIRCTKAGDIDTALFSVTSLRGDNMNAVAFEDGVERAIGTSGLRVTLTHDEYGVFEAGDFWAVRVNGTRPRVQVTDSRGIDQGSFTAVSTGTQISLGLSGIVAEFGANNNEEAGFAPGGGLVTGDKFYVRATAASSGAYRTLVLEDSLPEDADIGTLEFHLPQASAAIDRKRVQAPPLSNWSADMNGITVNAGIAVQDPTWVDFNGELPYLPVVSAQAYVEYRALLQDYAGSIFSFETAAQVAAELGTIHPDNPLALGVHMALLNSGSQAVFFAGVREDSLAGYSEILELAEKTDSMYSVVALSEAPEVVDAVQGHVLAMSKEDVKRWRIGWCSTALPTTTELFNAQLNGGNEWFATVTGVGNTTLDITNDNPGLFGAVRVGDIVRLLFATDAWGTPTWREIRVAGVVSNSRLVLEDGLDAPINEPEKIEIYRRNRASEVATRVASTAAAFGSRRMYYVAPLDVHIAAGNATIVTRPIFAAAALAGLTSSMAPQRPMTNITLTGFSQIPAAYRVFNRADLNVMATGGTFILAQDKEDGPIYIRHQLSTAASDGNLLTSELSVVKNFDAVSYYFSGVLSPYLGRYNITPELLRAIRTDLDGGIGFLQSAYTGAGLLGPMVLSEGTGVRRVEQHPTLKDHIVAIVDLGLPLPVNVIQLRLVV